MSEAPPPTPQTSPPPRELCVKHEQFAQAVVSGETYSDAYRAVYKRKKATRQQVADRCKEILATAGVRERIRELLARSEANSLLSLNDRLGILGRAARLPVRTAADRNAAARVIEVYNKTAGDGAPERSIVSLEGDADKPLHVVNRTATKAEKVAALLAQRKQRLAAAAPAAP